MLKGLTHYLLTNDVDVMFPTKKGDYSEYRSDYLECHERDKELPEKELSERICEWCQDLCQEYTEDDLDFNMKDDDDIAGHSCVVTGVVGRWDGNFGIEPKKFDDTIGCFRKLIYANYDHIYTLRRTGRWTFVFREAHHDSNGTCLKITVKH